VRLGAIPMVVLGVCSVQVLKCGNHTDMKRDMDLIREILLWIESDPKFNGTNWVGLEKTDNLSGLGDHSFEEIAYHLTMLVEAGFVRGNIGMEMPVISKLTWNGHEFLDDIKDKNIWENTKKRVAGLSGVALSVVAEIAKAEIKKKLGLQ
jgi:hypothetical protein